MNVRIRIPSIPARDTMDTVGAIQLAENSAQRTPCVLVIDCSESMVGEKIAELSAGLRRFAREVKADDAAKRSVRLAVVRVHGGAPEIAQDWTDARDFNAPESLNVLGSTPLGAGMDLALKMVSDEKVRLHKAGIKYNRPWVWLISDGEPTDEGWEAAADRSRQAEVGKHAKVYVVGVEGANFDKLKKFSNDPPLRLKGADFKSLFSFLSQSVRAASRAAPGTARDATLPEAITLVT